MADDEPRQYSAEDVQTVRVLASYSPAAVVLRYAKDPDPQPPAAPEREDFDAAIGFVDVSGFTALSEALNKQYGRKGSEYLNKCSAPRRARAALARGTSRPSSPAMGPRHRQRPPAAAGAHVPPTPAQFPTRTRAAPRAPAPNSRRRRQPWPLRCEHTRLLAT